MSLKFEFTTVAQCGPEHIWRIFEDIERWPRWDPEAIQSARWVSGAPWEKGSRFEIRIAKPMSYTITPEVIDVQPPIYIHWRGKGSGVKGEQFFIFKPLPDGTTEMHTLQEFSGAPVAMFRNKIRGPIQAGIEHMFARIKSEAEALAASPIEIPTATPTETLAEILATTLAQSLAVSPEETPVASSAETPAAVLPSQQESPAVEEQAPISETKPEEPS